MPIIDMHCDTLIEMISKKKSLLKNDLKVSIGKLKEAHVICQFFAMFIRLTDHDTLADAWNYMLTIYNKFVQEMDENPDSIKKVTSYNEISRKQNKISAILTLEEGGIIDDRLEKIDELYKMGVRLITLTWNFENCIGYPNSDEEQIMNAGLKPFGREVIEKMNDIGILIDVSHLSDGGFWDIVKLSSKPFVASHSNSRTIKNARRNLTDPMLKVIADKGGVVGINFYNKFLGDSEIGTISQMITHIKYIKKIAGIDVIALGSDFDGFDSRCEIRDSSEFGKLVDLLKLNNFTFEEIEKITYKNVMRVMKDVL
ncbi:MAG: dipeptidase [Fusobacteriaceae bacterium]|jgi:membrane dipeptidase|nr:dipeptidase [Fusobacteriaceae bacterium]